MSKVSVRHRPLVLVAGILFLGVGCAKPNDGSEAENLLSNQSTTFTPQTISCSATAAGDFKLAGAISYSSPVRSLEALKSTFANTTINVFDQWVKSGSPVRINLRNLNVVSGANRLEGRGLTSSTESLFDVVMETKASGSGSQMFHYVDKIRVYHKNMGRSIEASCPAPRLPTASATDGINALGAGYFKMQCPNARKGIRFRMNMDRYAAEARGTMQSQLQYNQGATWVPTDGSTVSSNGSVISMGNLYSFASWTGRRILDLPFDVKFPGDFRISYKVKDSSGRVLREFASEPVRVARRGSGCELDANEVFHSVPEGLETKAQSVEEIVGASPSNPNRGPLCPDVRPTGYQGTRSLTIIEQRECESSIPTYVTRQLEAFSNDEGKRNRCLIAYYDKYCR